MSDAEIKAMASELGGSGAKFSPDGQWVLFQRTDDELKSIWKVRVDGSEEKELFERTGYVCCANFSPDGQLISFNIGDPDLDIWVMDANGNNLRALTTNEVHDGGPGWILAGSKLSFTSVHDGNFDLAGIYTINPDGSDKKRIHPIEFRAFDPAWSNDGSFLLVQHVQGQNVDLYRMNPETGATQRITDSDSADWYPAISPDDQTIAYRNNESGNWDIYLMSPNGENKRKVTNSDNEDRSPSFSPNGRYIAWQSRAEGTDKFQIWLMNVDGTEPRNITQDTFDNQGPRWSPNSKQLVYSAKVNGRSQVMRIDMEGKEKVLLTPKRN